MKTTLKISLLFNLGLAGVLIFLWADGRKAPAASTPPVLSAQPTMAVAVPPPMPVSAPRVEPVPFNWSQLASADYRTYVKNLRRMGCPEATLRAIVTADVDARYRRRSWELEKKLDDLNNGSWAVQLSTYHDQQALKLEMQKLPAAESADINDFLGLKPATAEPFQPMASAVQTSGGEIVPVGNQVRANVAANIDVANPGAVQVASAATVSALGQTAAFPQPLVAGQLPPTPKSASLPLVFQPVDQSSLNLNASQQQAVNNLRQDFINNVSSSSQNPADPAYQQTWQQAQSQSDQMTVVQLGYNAYMQYWLAQYQNSLAAQVQSSQ
jgi:hypothetical protein